MKKIGYKTKAAAAAEAAAKMERKPARRNDARIIRRVIRRQESVTRKDIADWKRARLQATSTYEPKQVLLQRLFSEVIDDALMTSQVSVLRIGKSQGAEFELKMNGRKDEAETQKFKDSGLYEDLVELIVEAQFFNHSLIEFDYDPAERSWPTSCRVRTCRPKSGNSTPTPKVRRRWIIDFCRSSAAGSLRSTRANATSGCSTRPCRMC